MNEVSGKRGDFHFLESNATKNFAFEGFVVINSLEKNEQKKLLKMHDFSITKKLFNLQ